MQDPRALANTANLKSYRAWGQEGFRRSGFLPITLMTTLLAPVFTLSITRFAHLARGGHDWVVLIGAALAIYLAACLGLALFAVYQLKAWQRAHPWSPPAPRNPASLVASSYR
jgi:hypothetical protein